MDYYYIHFGFTHKGIEVDGVSLIQSIAEDKAAKKLIKDGKAFKLSNKVSKEMFEAESKIEEDDWDADEP